MTLAEMELHFVEKSSVYGTLYECRLPDIGFRDEKGRIVGYQFEIFFGKRAGGEGFWVKPHVLRNGQTFGASPDGHLFPTLDEAKLGCKALLAKRVKEYSLRFSQEQK